MIQPTRFQAASLPFLACIETSIGGDRHIGTGTLITPRLILTAGHVVFNPHVHIHTFNITLGWPRRSILATQRQTTTLWRDRDSLRPPNEQAVVSTDIGIIVLDEPINVIPDGQQAPAIDTQMLEPRELNVAGYSAEHPATIPNDAFFAKMNGKILRASSGNLINHRIAYPVNTFAGMSGAPVWAKVNGNRTIQGIHTSEFRGDVGTALRINPPIVNLLRRWMREFHS